MQFLLFAFYIRICSLTYKIKNDPVFKISGYYIKTADAGIHDFFIPIRQPVHLSSQDYDKHFEYHRHLQERR